MNKKIYPVKVADLRPNQLLFNFGVGAIMDLPNSAVMIQGLDSWTHIAPPYTEKIVEDRLLALVNQLKGHEQVEALYPPPLPESSRSYQQQTDSFSPNSWIGIPAKTFPQWFVCPRCQQLAKYDPDAPSNNIEFIPHYTQTGKTHFVHLNCEKSKKKPPTVVPARFLYGCTHGHLDEFPWVSFVHSGGHCTKASPQLRLYELDELGQTTGLFVQCTSCGTSRSMIHAFDSSQEDVLPPCSGYHPHLGTHSPCTAEEQRVIPLSASNLWFPVLRSVLSLPVIADDTLSKLVAEHWATLTEVETKDDIGGLMKFSGLKGYFTDYTYDQLWQAIEAHRHQATPDKDAPLEIKPPEYALLSSATPPPPSDHFKTRSADLSATPRLAHYFDKVVLVERLREVRALVGFTRISSADEEFIDEIEMAPLSIKPTNWLPADEMLGEGIFIQFKEELIQSWLQTVIVRNTVFENAYLHWLKAHKKAETLERYPGMRYILLHSFSHALMRSLSLECGYNLASIRERIYSAEATEAHPAMAGVLLYTAASDSEGTLGGLVRLGEPESLQLFIHKALETAEFCASDPLCAETKPDESQGKTIHGASCHACAFTPETSCEKGNRFLDRAVLSPTIDTEDFAFFCDWFERDWS